MCICALMGMTAVVRVCDEFPVLVVPPGQQILPVRQRVILRINTKSHPNAQAMTNYISPPGISGHPQHPG